jgi:phage tail-like protein
MTTPARDPTFRLLGGDTGWRSARGHDDWTQAEQVSAGAGPLLLATDPDGPLALTAADGSLGGLVLPRGVALDGGGTFYLLDRRGPWIRRYDAKRQAFVRLPSLGDTGDDARRFNDPVAIAIAGQNLYVADRGNRRIQVFALRGLALRHVWGPWDGRGRPVAATDAAAWLPVDVAAHGGNAYILDARHGRVYRHQPGIDRPALVIREEGAAGRWSRIALDRAGRIYLLDTATRRLEIYEPAIPDRHHRRIGAVTEAGVVRGRFDPPPALPPQLETRPRNRQRYATRGWWISEEIDSEVYECRWHRIDLDLASLPAGSRVLVGTYTDEQLRGPQFIRDLPAQEWETGYAVAGQMQQPAPAAGQQPAGARAAGEAPAPVDFLIQNRPGRYLWIKVELEGDGYDTPAVRGMRVHFPRDSYLRFLPAVYSADDESRSFLERFLSIVQTEWDGLERRIEALPRYVDPAAVPGEGGFLEYLAGWLALPLEGTWSAEQRRRLLVAARRIYPRRGTAAGLRDFLQVYLQNIADVLPEEQGDYPSLVEGFRERQRLLLAVDDLARLRTGAPLWSAAVVGRLQSDVYAREGEVRLVSTGDPQHDLFHEYAHRFRVVVPAAWIRTAGAEQMLRRAIEMEKPAQTVYELDLVEPRFRVGLQSSVGIDTIVGTYPEVRLACCHETDRPPSLPPPHRLGYDTVLACPSNGEPNLRLAPGMRLGTDTLLT